MKLVVASKAVYQKRFVPCSVKTWTGVLSYWQHQFLAPYTAPGMDLFALSAASSSVGRPVPVTSLPTVTQ